MLEYSHEIVGLCGQIFITANEEIAHKNPVNQ